MKNSRAVHWAAALRLQRRADDPLFARAKNDQVGTVAHRALPISDNVIYAFNDRIRVGFAKRDGAALRGNPRPRSRRTS
jgi:hypothetical protein